MEEALKILEETKKLVMLKYPRFSSNLAKTNFYISSHLKYHTAATDGENIYFDPNYIVNLSEDDRIFVMAHELMHIRFGHAQRIYKKDGEARDPNVWNEATDAIINANLEHDKFTIPLGAINRPGALEYNSEELYEILLQEKQNQPQEQGQDGEEQENSEGQDGKEIESSENGKTGKKTKKFVDDHSLWGDSEEKEKIKESSESQEQEGKGKEDKKDKTTAKEESQGEEEKEEVKKSSEDGNDEDFDEAKEFEKNREERRARAKEELEKLKKELMNNDHDMTSLGDVGRSQEELDWKLLLRREIEKEEIVWSQRRSIKENNYAYRLEEEELEDEAKTEVMIDVSGSVDLNLVRAFLRILKPIIKESQLRVGCFNERYWGMVEINSERDIDNFKIPSAARSSSYAWTEDWDLAVRSFTKEEGINKIVFTDGYPCPGTMPADDLKNENVIWLVYGNKNFHPCCGKVIQITEKQISRLSSFTSDMGSTKHVR